MYKIIHFFSAIIRYFLPNPYITLFANKNIADGFNVVIGGTILGTLSHLMTKSIYSKGIDEPAIGSFWYLVNYCYLTAVITLLGKFIINIKTVIIVFLSIYIISCIVEYKLKTLFEKK